MFVRTLDNSPSSPVPAHDSSSGLESDDPPPALLPMSSQCWATKAQCDLAQAEVELCRLQERYTNETELIKQSLERAILGARREEVRLLERVEQDHRDTQQQLEQVQKENMAASRVSRSLLDQRFEKLAQLQKQIQEISQQPGLDESWTHQNLLLKEISEFLQPWGMSVSLKKVNFKPSSQPNAVTFGDISVKEQSLCLNVGSCGPQGQPCALHSHEMDCEYTNQQNDNDDKRTVGQGWTTPMGRIVRKISLSTKNGMRTMEQKFSTKISPLLPKCEQSNWESSQNDEVGTRAFQAQGENVFETVPTALKNMDMEGKDQVYAINANRKHRSPRIQKMQLTMATSKKPPPVSEEKLEYAKLRNSLCIDSQDADNGQISPDPNSRILWYGNSVLTSPQMTARGPVISQSCLDLTSKHRPYSCLSQSSDEYSLGRHGDSVRAPSPTDSLDSTYTFIVSPSNDFNMKKGSSNYNCHLSKSAVDLTHKTCPSISSGASEHAGLWRLKCGNLNPATTSPTLNRQPRTCNIGQTYLHPTCGIQIDRRQKDIKVGGSKQPMVARSLSMSALNGPTRESKRGREEPTLVGMEEEGDVPLTEFNPRGVHLIRQFGKQGSGRADLTLPSGIHATPQGQLFIADCGNSRVQVTDHRGNVLQQVTSPTSNGSGRQCRNYFDLAVNAKGLIALSCAAERALLVFNKHGRLLQSFGGSGFGAKKDELESPRGVTTTRLDEFLVADIRKGTLIAMKLDPKTGCRLERTVVTGFHRPYLVAACLSSGMIAVSERGNETGRQPCIKVLGPSWNTLRVLGVCAGMGPVLFCPWGICIDAEGNVLVADWGEEHRVLIYPAQGMGWPIVTQGLSSPRGLTLLPEGQLAVSDSMHHCIKIYKYRANQA